MKAKITTVITSLVFAHFSSVVCSMDLDPEDGSIGCDDESGMLQYFLNSDEDSLTQSVAMSIADGSEDGPLWAETLDETEALLNAAGFSSGVDYSIDIEELPVSDMTQMNCHAYTCWLKGSAAPTSLVEFTINPEEIGAIIEKGYDFRGGFSNLNSLSKAEAAAKVESLFVDGEAREGDVVIINGWQRGDDSGDVVSAMHSGVVIATPSNSSGHWVTSKFGVGPVLKTKVSALYYGYDNPATGGNSARGIFSVLIYRKKP